MALIDSCNGLLLFAYAPNLDGLGYIVLREAAQFQGIQFWLGPVQNIWRLHCLFVLLLPWWISCRLVCDPPGALLPVSCWTMQTKLTMGSIALEFMGNSISDISELMVVHWTISELKFMSLIFWWQWFWEKECLMLKQSFQTNRAVQDMKPSVCCF
jgi:hypothetical protein